MVQFHHTISDSYKHVTWRLIETPPMPGPWNMALDEAIAEAVGAGQQPPTLRYYRWEPPCLSLGFAQPAADVDFARLKDHGWDIVRRLTGGRAILHIDELTYSITAPEREPRVAGGVVESYRRLSRGLLMGLEDLGAAVHSEEMRDGKKLPQNPVCFEVPSDWEITVEGRKLVGSAQTRRGEAVLQHGALPLTGRITRICEALVFPDAEAREDARYRVMQRAATLADALGVDVAFDVVADALTGGFRRALNLSFEQDEISPAEVARAEDLIESRYGNEAWTLRL